VADLGGAVSGLGGGSARGGGRAGGRGKEKLPARPAADATHVKTDTGRSSRRADTRFVSPAQLIKA